MANYQREKYIQADVRYYIKDVFKAEEIDVENDYYKNYNKLVKALNQTIEKHTGHKGNIYQGYNTFVIPIVGIDDLDDISSLLLNVFYSSGLDPWSSTISIIKGEFCPKINHIDAHWRKEYKECKDEDKVLLILKIHLDKDLTEEED